MSSAAHTIVPDATKAGFCIALQKLATAGFGATLLRATQHIGHCCVAAWDVPRYAMPELVIAMRNWARRPASTSFIEEILNRL